MALASKHIISLCTTKEDQHVLVPATPSEAPTKLHLYYVLVDLITVTCFWAVIVFFYLSHSYAKK